jgi:DeoR/GlpR family transcriptional regulator of sugar metabolism
MTMGLNDRQIKALRYIVQNQSISRSEYVKRFNVSLRTANYDPKLVEVKGLIERKGVGRAIRYILK